MTLSSLVSRSLVLSLAAIVLLPLHLHAQVVDQVTATSTAPPGVPFVRVPLLDGMRTVSGAQGPGAKPASIEVMVTLVATTLPRPASDTAPVYVQRAVTKSIGDDGSFDITFSTPLVAGQYVVVCARGADDKATAAGCHQPLPVEAADDWGRVRAYFAGGVVLSKQRADFSQQDMTLSFTLDKTWWMDAPTGRLAPRAFNSFFDVRLTSVPVGLGTTTTTTPSGGATPTTTVEQFTNSQKAAVVQAGFYLPLFSEDMTWVHGGQKNAVFLAPVFKAGVITAGGSDAVTTTTNTGGGGSSVTTSAGNASGVYKFIAFGFGVGHETLTASTDSAPTIMSYLHVTVGKWENFPGSDWRIAAEGRLKVPTTPFQVGFDANVPYRGGGLADLRFTLGARVDIGTLLAKIKLLGG
ncbi:MAG: hypothetical protein LAO77_15470 [Acidobacteriia bacterium]|nr:hypothetical protein [Terriglobia bacterium]